MAVTLCPSMLYSNKSPTTSHLHASWLGNLRRFSQPAISLPCWNGRYSSGAYSFLNHKAADCLPSTPCGWGVVERLSSLWHILGPRQQGITTCHSHQLKYDCMHRIEQLRQHVTLFSCCLNTIGSRCQYINELIAFAPFWLPLFAISFGKIFIILPIFSWRWVLLWKFCLKGVSSEN